MEANAKSIIRHLARDMPTAMMDGGDCSWELKRSGTPPIGTEKSKTRQLPSKADYNRDG